MKKLPRAIGHSKYVYYSVKCTPGLKSEQASHINALFSVANEIIELGQIAEQSRGNTLAFPISRQIITELHTWRHGIYRLGSRKFDFIEGAPEDLRDSLTTQFDRLFRQVTKHRNVLQHYQEYLFGDQRLAEVTQSELDRIGFNITMERGSSVEIYNCYVHDLFCSSDRQGRIREVWLGPSLAHRVSVMLQAIVQGISMRSQLSIALRPRLTYEELDHARQAGRHDLIGTTPHQ